MKISILGPLEIEFSGGPVRLESRKQRLLLAALLVHAPRAVASERLVDALWSDELPADPQGALQVHVSRLRRSLSNAYGSDLLVTEPHGYRLEVSDLELDSARFEVLVNEARSGSDPDQGLRQLEQALDLWRGAALAEFCELPFARAEAARMEELRTSALEFKADCLIELGRWGAAIALLERLVADDPLRERPRDQLARALYFAGRHGDSLAVCRQYRRLVSEELGLDPSPALQRLEEQLIRRELPEPGPGDAPAEITDDRGDTDRRGPAFEISYSDAGGRRIAVGRAGKGPTLVVLPGFVSNLTTFAEGRDPRSPLLKQLSESFSVVTYDRFGTGMSPGSPDDYSVPASAAELAAVIDELDQPSVNLLAISCAGPIAVELAARRPDPISRVVFLGTYADGPATFGDPRITASIVSLVRSHWGLGSKLMMDLMYPCATSEWARLFARWQREAAPVDVAAGYLQAMFDADVARLLGEVTSPSLVIHYTGDRAIPFRGGQRLASGLPEARLIPLGGSLHLPEGEEARRVCELITDFVIG